jgi:hypothetical protein
MGSDDGMFKELELILGSAVVTVAIVFGLFNSILADLVPPFEDSQQTVGFVSVGTVVILLILTLALRNRLAALHVKPVAAISAGLFLAALFVYFPFREFVRANVYRYPPASIAHSNQTRHVRGEIHELGKQRMKNMTVAQAVYTLGGPDEVNGMGVLWFEESRLANINKMERYYVCLIFLFNLSLFSASLTVWRVQRAQRRKP